MTAEVPDGREATLTVKLLTNFDAASYGVIDYRTLDVPICDRSDHFLSVMRFREVDSGFFTTPSGNSAVDFGTAAEDTIEMFYQSYTTIFQMGFTGMRLVANVTAWGWHELQMYNVNKKDIFGQVNIALRLELQGKF